jgi:hypothetical protein
VTETAMIRRYPKEGFDLSDAQQRKNLFLTIFTVLNYGISGQARLSVRTHVSKQQIKVCLIHPDLTRRILQSRDLR